MKTTILKQVRAEAFKPQYKLNKWIGTRYMMFINKTGIDDSQCIEELGLERVVPVDFEWKYREINLNEVQYMEWSSMKDSKDRAIVTTMVDGSEDYKITTHFNAKTLKTFLKNTSDVKYMVCTKNTTSPMLAVGKSGDVQGLIMPLRGDVY